MSNNTLIAASDGDKLGRSNIFAEEATADPALDRVYNPRKYPDELAGSRDWELDSSYKPRTYPKVADERLSRPTRSIPSYISQATSITNAAITQLIQWQPAAANLFEVDFGDDSKLLCSAVSFPGARLNLTRHKATRQFMLEGYEPADEITITWREDSDFSVRKLHEEWFSHFYNRSTDKYISGGEKGKTAIIYLQKYSSRSLISAGRLQLTGLLPTSIPDLSLDWAKAEMIDYTITYKVTSWSWLR